MTNIRKTLLAIGVIAAAGAFAGTAPVEAQVYATTIAPRGWLGISYDETIVIHDRNRVASVVITDVSKDSPAEKAGLLVGDTIVRVNDFRASTEILRSMGASLEPGDKVRFVVRRDGRDRTLDVVVAKRPAQVYVQGKPGQSWTYSFNPDSVRGMMKLFADSMYAGLDSSRMRIFRFDTTVAGEFRRMHGDSLLFGAPGTAFELRFGRDSLRALMPGRIFTDSFMRMPNGVFIDSMFHVIPGFRRDSLFQRAWPGGARGMATPRGGVPPVEVPGVPYTPEVIFRSFAGGMSAFAGAELTNLNENLGEYFGAQSGALVLSVPEGSPAARAGLEPGDIVTKVDGTDVATVTALRRAVERARRGAPIKLQVIRHKKAMTIDFRQ